MNGSGGGARAERKEDGIYAYEFGNGVSWALIAGAALVFLGPVNPGTTQAQLEQVSVSTQSQMLTEAPFTINTEELTGGVEVAAYILQEGPFLNGATSGTLPLSPPVTPDNPLLITGLRGADGTPVAYDVLIYGVKESLSFDATNAAKGLVMFLLSDSNLPTDRLITIYSKIEAHSDFPSLVGFIRTHKGYPDDDALIDSMIDISSLIINDLVAELNGTQEPTGSLITPQTVRSGYGFPKTSTFTLTQPEDSSAVTVEASSMLEFRLMIFEGGVGRDALS